MGKVKVSVLLPSLNVHKYISECLESVLRQTLKEIEIICIDAGSTDGTLDIIKNFMMTDDRIRLIISEKKSYGYQLNRGIISSNGEYIGIVDTDDYIKDDMYEHLYECACHNDADVVKSDFYIFFDSKDKRIYQKMSYGDSGGVYGGGFSVNDYVDGKQQTDTFIWNSIYKKEYLTKNDIRFNESPGAAYQDCGFRYQVFSSVRNLFYLEDAYYYYRRDNAGSSMFSRKSFTYNIDECKYLADRLLGPDIQIELRKFLSRMIIETISISYKECLFNGIENIQLEKQLFEVKQWIELLIDAGILVYEGCNVASDYDFIGDTNCFLDDSYRDTEYKRESYIHFYEEVRKYNRSIIFGAGKCGRAAYLLMARNNLCKSIIVCDTNPVLWGKSIYLNEIISPDEAFKLYDTTTDCYVVASKKYYSEIARGLCEKGIPERKIIKYCLETNPMVCSSDLHGLFGSIGI